MLYIALIPACVAFTESGGQRFLWRRPCNCVLKCPPEFAKQDLRRSVVNERASVSFGICLVWQIPPNKFNSLTAYSDFKLDNTQNFTADTTEGESNLEQARVLLGILEVMMGVAITDIPKKKQEAEKELTCYMALHDSLEQVLSQKQGRGLKKGAKSLRNRDRPSVSGKQAPSSGSKELKEERKPLLDSACIAHLLQLVTDKLSGRDGGSTQGPDDLVCKLGFFALRCCLRHLNAAASEKGDHCELASKLGNLIGSDWRILARPLSNLLLTLRTSGLAQASQDVVKDTSKTGKGRKHITNEAGENLILAALRCVDKIIRLSHQKHCATAVFRAFASDSGDSLPENQVEDDGEQAKLVDDWLVRQAQPLMLELLTQARWEEVEVNLCHFSWFCRSCVLLSLQGCNKVCACADSCQFDLLLGR